MISSKPSVSESVARRLPAVISNTIGALLLVTGFATNALGSEDVPFEEVGGDQCFMFFDLVPYRAEGDRTVELPLQLVIDNERDYKKIFDPQTMRESCADIDPSKRVPDVDFAKKTVLGLWSSGSCADIGFEKRVLKDDIQKWVIYSVTIVSENMSCSGPGLEGLNLIAIPKIPPGYQVFFENLRKDK
jgi:hypothetical protein